MALNKYMHPRNPYKTRKPDFKALAIKYPEFRERVVHKLNGNVVLDFKDADSLRALTMTLLKEDFGLDVSLPVDRLIPTVPQRLNYILWLEDILGPRSTATGIDIGTGASCIYPMLGCRQNGWHFLASDIDDQNIACARRNIQHNGMADNIQVRKVSENTMLAGLVDADTSYDFCMCNPPFFSDLLEAQGATSRHPDRRPPRPSASTASPQDSISWGGEVTFVTRMIDESLILRNQIRVYSSMLGKKMSLMLLKDELRRRQIGNFSSMEFCQGRTMRWGLAWTFDDTVAFPKSPFKEGKNVKPPITYAIPRANAAVPDYTVPAVAQYLNALFADLQLKVNVKHSGKFYAAMMVQAKHNTWTHQRRKRREKLHGGTQAKGGEALSGQTDCGEGKDRSIPGYQSHVDCTGDGNTGALAAVHPEVVKATAGDEKGLNVSAGGAGHADSSNNGGTVCGSGARCARGDDVMEQSHGDRHSGDGQCRPGDGKLGDGESVMSPACDARTELEADSVDTTYYKHKQSLSQCTDEPTAKRQKVEEACETNSANHIGDIKAPSPDSVTKDIVSSNDQCFPTIIEENDNVTVSDDPTSRDGRVNVNSNDYPTTSTNDNVNLTPKDGPTIIEDNVNVTSINVSTTSRANCANVTAGVDPTASSVSVSASDGRTQFTEASISTFSVAGGGPVEGRGTHLRRDIVRRFWEEKAGSGTTAPQFDETDDCLVQFKLVLRKDEGRMGLTMTWSRGDREAVHQIMQLLKNRLAEVKS